MRLRVVFSEGRTDEVGDGFRIKSGMTREGLEMVADVRKPRSWLFCRHERSVNEFASD